MCGGANNHQPEEMPTPDPTYTAPDLRDVYKTFKETGAVPYSYYGNQAPTREGELEAVRKSYPGAFPAGAPASTTAKRDPMIEALKRLGPFGSMFGGLVSYGRDNGYMPKL